MEKCVEIRDRGRQELEQKKFAALKAAFPHTIPVLTGYLFLGMAFGILLQSKGYGPLWALLMSVFIFAGSMQFVATGLLASGFHPLQAAVLTLLVNARHIFYGLAMLDKFRDLKKSRFYLIFSLTDETFSLFCSVEPPQEVDPTRFRLSIAALDQLYWITGSVAGAFLGTALPFDSTGIDFVMTALFVVIFLEQWLGGKGRKPAVMGVAAAVICRALFGAEWFLLPTMAVLVAALLLGRGAIDREVAQP